MRTSTCNQKPLLFVLPMILFACGPSGPGQPEAGTNGLQLMDAALKAALPEVFGTEHLHVPKGELACAEADFTDHLHLGDSASHAPIPLPAGGIRVKCADLLSALNGVEPCEPTGPIARGIVVHYGLSARDEFDVRLQLLCLKYDVASEEYHYADSKDCYQIKADGSLDFVPDGLTAWRTTGGWHNYANRVMIRSNSNSRWTRIDAATEPISGLHGEDAVRDLIAQNRLEDGMLAFAPIATPQYREQLPDSTYDERGFHQGVAWVPVGVDLDDSTYKEEPFRAKALDLASPCPHSCPTKKFKFWDKGTAPRQSCQ